LATVAKKAKPRATVPVPTPPREPTAWESIKSHPRLATLVVVAVIAAVAVAVVLGRGSHPRARTTPISVPPIGPKLVNASALKAFARVEGQVIYWVGPVAGDRYELTRTTANDIFVRYLPRKVKVGSKGKYFLVATYPSTTALTDLKSGAYGQPLKVAGAKGAVAAVVPGSPTNVRLAFPHVAYEVEVYDPHSPKHARTLATSGAVTQIG
jgi:hypothetical protein